MLTLIKQNGVIEMEYITQAQATQQIATLLIMVSVIAFGLLAYYGSDKYLVLETFDNK
jgi:hypothetical protein